MRWLYIVKRGTTKLIEENESLKPSVKGILTEAYVQEGILLAQGGINENEKAFEYFKKAV